MNQEHFDLVTQAIASGKMVDFPGADLSRADLVGANLVGADLSRANLWGADLGGARNIGASMDAAAEIVRQAQPSRAVLSQIGGVLLSRPCWNELAQIVRGMDSNVWSRIKEILLEEEAWGFRESINKIESLAFATPD